MASGLTEFGGNAYSTDPLKEAGKDLVSGSESQLKSEGRNSAGRAASAIIALSAAAGVAAKDNEMSDLEYYNYMVAQNNVTQSKTSIAALDSEIAREVVESGEITRNQIAQIQSQIKSGRWSFEAGGGNDVMEGAITYVDQFKGVQLEMEKINGDADFVRLATSLGFKISEKGIVTISASDMRDKLEGTKQSSYGAALYFVQLNRFVETLKLYVVHDDIESENNEFVTDGISSVNGSIRVNQSRTVGGEDTRYGIGASLRPLENMLLDLGFDASSRVERGYIGIDTKTGENTVLYARHEEADFENGGEFKDTQIGFDRRTNMKVWGKTLTVGVNAFKKEFQNGFEMDGGMLTVELGSSTRLDRFQREVTSDMKQALSKSTRDVSLYRSDLLTKESNELNVLFKIVDPSLVYDKNSSQVLLDPGSCVLDGEGDYGFSHYAVKVNGKDTEVSGNKLSINPGDSVSVVAFHEVTIDGFTTMVPSNEVSLDVPLPAPAQPIKDVFNFNVDAGETTTQTLNVLRNDLNRDSLTIIGVSGAGFSAQGNQIIFTGGAGTYTGEYTVKNTDGEQATASISITVRENSVNPENEAPEAQNDTISGLEEGKTTSVSKSQLTANDTDDSGDTPTFVSGSIASVSGGTVVENGSNIDITPNPGSTNVSFDYTSQDAEGLTDIATASGSVDALPTPDVPSVSFTAPAAGDTSVTFTADTASGNTTMWFLNGSPVPGETGSTYTASGLSVGSYTISAQSCNTSGDCSANSVDQNFEVTPAISTPEINPIPDVNINDDGGFSTSVVATITGTDIQPGAIFSIDSVTGLTLNTGVGFTISGNTISFQGDLGTSQSPVVTIKVVNSDGGTDTESFTVNINNDF